MLVKEELLQLDLGADGLESLLDFLGLVLGDGFLDLGGDAFNKSLGFAEAETGDLADDLDDLDLLSAEAGHDNVKLSLLFSSGSAGSRSSSNSNSSGSSGGNAELILKSMDQLSQVQNSKSLDLFDKSSDFFASQFTFPP